MNRHCIMTVLLAAVWTTTGQAQSPAAPEAWRSSMDAFAREVVAVAAKSAIPSGPAFLGPNGRLADAIVIQDAKGVQTWVIIKGSLENEFQAELVKRFTGQVAWSAVVVSVNSDKGDHTIKLAFSKPKKLQDKIEFPKPPEGRMAVFERSQRIEFDDVLVSIPVVKLPSAKLPKKGDTFSFRGELARAKGEGELDTVFPLYGVGPNRGKISIGLFFRDAEPAQ
jgi:hypothetical protein